jgi:hydroxymethylpyrimidine/phosphomethylpyrimidine kinase
MHIWRYSMDDKAAREQRVTDDAQAHLTKLKEVKGMGYATTVHAIAIFAGTLNELAHKDAPEWIRDRLSQVATILTAEFTEACDLAGREHEMVRDAESLMEMMMERLEEEFPEGYKPDESAEEVSSSRVLH